MSNEGNSINFIDELYKITPINNEYLQKYLLFIVGVKNQADHLFGEKHHILPKSLFPEFRYNKLNLKFISAKNHFIAHYLLYKAYPDNRQMICAFKLMFDMYKGKKILDENILNEYALEYEIARILVSKKNSDNLKGRIFSDEHRKNLSIANIGNPNVGQKGRVLTAEHKAKITASKIGVKQSDTHRESNRNARLGKKHTEEHKNKISLANKGKTPKNLELLTAQKRVKSNLTEERVILLIGSVVSGKSTKEVSLEMNIPNGTVYGIITGNRWKDIIYKLDPLIKNGLNDIRNSILEKSSKKSKNDK